MDGGGFQVQNFGCRANQADGAAIARALEGQGWRAAEASDTAADLVIFNTCTVTAAADAEARHAIRRLHRLRPRARIWVTGCYAQRAPEELRRLDGVERVLGHGEKAAIAALAGRPQAAHPAREMAPAPRTALAPGRTRPQVKVQDGCGNACAFCVIPAVRGGLQSRPAAAVIAEIRDWGRAGAQEIVLTGIHLGQWGRDLIPRRSLPDLLRGILAETAMGRIRLSSVEPMNWSGELIALLAGEPRLAPHAHIPLQSGSDAVLRRMRRRYRPGHYAARVQEIHRRLPDAAIGADVMAGFPGETEAEFEETLAFLCALPLSYLHVFTFSPRPGTEAARRMGQPGWEAVAAGTAGERACQLRELSERWQREFAGRFLGRRLDLLTLHEQQDGWTRALSGNFLDVWLAGAWPANVRRQAEATGWRGEGLAAGAISPAASSSGLSST